MATYPWALVFFLNPAPKAVDLSILDCVACQRGVLSLTEVLLICSVSHLCFLVGLHQWEMCGPHCHQGNQTKDTHKHQGGWAPCTKGQRG
jgi:hypothetical protein